MKRALITGITGEDGSYLAKLLLENGYEVHGLIRRASTFNISRIEHLHTDPHVEGVRLVLHNADLTDGSRLVTLLDKIPDEVYHLAAQSHVKVSFDEPEFTGLTTGLGTTRLLEAIRMVGLTCRYYRCTSTWATSTRCATGATPPSASRPCGACSRSTNPATTSSPRHRPHRPRLPHLRLRARRPQLNDARPSRRPLSTPQRIRPSEVDSLIGDPSRAQEALRWKAQVLTPELAQIMVDADLHGHRGRTARGLPARDGPAGMTQPTVRSPDRLWFETTPDR